MLLWTETNSKGNNNCGSKRWKTIGPCHISIIHIMKSKFCLFVWLCACSRFLTQCTLSAKNWDATKNPAVDLKLILMHHFSSILPLDLAQYCLVLSTALNSYFTHLNNHSKYGRPKVLTRVIYAPRYLPTVCISVCQNSVFLSNSRGTSINDVRF